MEDISFLVTIGCIAAGVLLGMYVQKRVDDISNSPLPVPEQNDFPKTFDEIERYWWCRSGYESLRKWKRKINIENLSIQDRDAAFRYVFGFYPWQCRVNRSGSEGLNVVTPAGEAIGDGGFGYYTDEPTLKSYHDIWSRNGVSWDIDCNGKRYHKLDSHTGLPPHWEMVKQQYILSHFLYTFEDGPDLLDYVIKPQQDES